VRLGPTGGKRQDGIQPIQGLNRALFIHTEDGGVRRRVQLESDNVRRFGFKVRIIADHATEAHHRHGG
jgi:hypothetical protein